MGIKFEGRFFGSMILQDIFMSQMNQKLLLDAFPQKISWPSKIPPPALFIEFCIKKHSCSPCGNSIPTWYYHCGDLFIFTLT